MKLSEIIVIKCAVLQINEELSLDVASWILPSTKKQRCRCVLHWRGNHYEKLHAIQYLPNFMVVPAMSNTNAALLDTHMDLVIDLEDTTKSLINSNGEVHIDVKMHDSMYRSFSYLLS
ncbi:MAG: hypothetical protein JSS82_07830 [Bacteroidetes bacterium]|nr:hypothetical protein [Bacteroidota bacterium]